MSATHRAGLIWFVDRYETTGEPQLPKTIAAELDVFDGGRIIDVRG